MAEAEECPPSGGGVIPLPMMDEEPHRGAPLLPQSIASAVSFATRSSSLSLRVGSFFGNAAVSGARTTTLTGLEFGRRILDAILSRAGRDAAENSAGDRGKEAAESYLERTVRVCRQWFVGARTDKIVAVGFFTFYNHSCFFLGILRIPADLSNASIRLFSVAALSCLLGPDLRGY